MLLRENTDECYGEPFLDAPTVYETCESYLGELISTLSGESYSASIR
jgi:hypothetical protein